MDRNKTNINSSTAIAQNFSQSAPYYDNKAVLQKQCAKSLARKIKLFVNELPKGICVDMGCGTGFLSLPMAHFLKKRPLYLVDISQEMLNICERNISHLNNGYFHFIKQNIKDNIIKEPISLIASSYTIQWLDDPITTINKWTYNMENNSLMALAFPEKGSFPEWQYYCKKANIPYTGNVLPYGAEIISALQKKFNVTILVNELHVKEETYTTPLDFFKYIKLIGAGYIKHNTKLNTEQFIHLVNTWHKNMPEKIIVSTLIRFIILKKV